MNKKVIFALGPALLLFSTLIGCGGNGGKSLSSISVTLNEPNKIYGKDYPISKSEFIVTATYSDKSTSIVNDWVSPEFGSEGTYTFKDSDIPEKTFNFSYKDKTARYSIITLNYELCWTKNITIGEEQNTAPYKLAQKSNEIVFGFTKDYSEVVKSLPSAEIGEKSTDKITCYWDKNNNKFYILSFGRIIVGDDDTYYEIEEEDYGMFEDCYDVSSLKFENFNTSNVSTMEEMFAECKALYSLDLSKFDTSAVETFENTFDGCSSLTSLNISSFNTSSSYEMGFMFRNCESLTSLDLSKFDTSNVINMDYMIQDCDSLTSLDLSKFDTSKVKNTDQMFYQDSGLKTIYVSDSFIINEEVTSKDMFFGCNNLVGGKGTTYSSEHVDKEYARIDQGPKSSAPGYFTKKDKY